MFPDSLLLAFVFLRPFSGPGGFFAGLSLESKDPGTVSSRVVAFGPFATFSPLFRGFREVLSSLALDTAAVFFAGWRFFLAPLSSTLGSAKNRERDGRSGKPGVEGRGSGVVPRGEVSRNLSLSLEDRGGVFVGVFGEEDKTMTSVVLVIATINASSPEA